MTKYSTSITINANPEAVWKVLSDVAHWHAWTPTVTKVEVLNTPESETRQPLQSISAQTPTCRMDSD